MSIFIIGEIGINHNGDVNLAKKLKAGDLSVKDIRTIKQEGIAGRKVDDDVIVETKESLTPSQQQLKQRFTNEQLLRKRKNAEGKELSDINNILIEAGARIGLRAMGFDTRKGLGNISYNDPSKLFTLFIN